MKILILYYSRTQTTKKVAEALAQKLGADTEEIIDKKDRSGVKGYISAGRDAMRKEAAEIDALKSNISDYDLVIVGTPIWGWTFTPAIRTLARDNKDKINNLALLITQGAKPPKQVEIFKQMEDEFAKPSMANLHLSTAEVKKDDFAKQLDEFLAKIKIDS